MSICKQVIKVFLFGMFLFYNGSCVAGKVVCEKQSDYIYRGDDGSVLIYPKTYEWLVCVSGFVLFTAGLGGYYLSDNVQAESVSISGIFAGAILLVASVYHTIKNYLERYDPLIKLDREGISFRGKHIGLWKNVKNISLRRHSYELVLEVKNNFENIIQDITLDLMHLPEDANKFLNRVQRFWNANKNK